MYTKETMWVDNNPGSSKEPMTSAEVKEYYISEFESVSGHYVNELWDKVVMSDNIPNRHDVEILEHWLHSANIEVNFEATKNRELSSRYLAWLNSISADVILD